MQKPTFFKRMAHNLLRPRQFMIMDGRSSRPARNMRLRPLTLLLAPLLLLCISFIMGMQYSPQHHDRSLIPQNLQLQRDFDSAREKIAEIEAVNDLKAAQIKSLQTTIDQQQARIEDLKRRNNMFESILEARKTAGVQILKATVRKTGDKQLEYNLVLVKGGNYPRRVTGHIQLLAVDAKQAETALLLDNGTTNLPYRMETHTFLHGTAHWDASVVPEHFMAVLYNHRGREIARTQCDTQGGN